MRRTKAAGKELGQVLVNTELIKLLGGEVINDAVDHLRMGGGRCWACRHPIHPTDPVSLVAQRTGAHDRLGFVHLLCAPPQILDDQRSRRRSIAAEKSVQEGFESAQAFALGRDHRKPHCLVVVSPETTVRVRQEEGEVVSPWLAELCREGFVPVAPDVIDVVPPMLENWTIRFTGGELTCGPPDRPLYVGSLPAPRHWGRIMRREQECTVLVAGVGVSTSVIGRAAAGALNTLAARGLIVGARVRIQQVTSLTVPRDRSTRLKGAGHDDPSKLRII